MINSFTEAQILRMRKMVLFAYEHSPYYKKLYAENGIDPETVLLPDGLPIVKHTELIEYSMDFRTDKSIYKLCASSGTYNNPKIMFRTRRDFEHSVCNEIELLKWCKIDENDVVAIVQPFGIWGYGEITQEAVRRIGAVSLPIGNISDEVALELIQKTNATVLDISPSRLKKILRIAQKKEIEKSLKFKCVMCAGEQVTREFVDYVNSVIDTKIYNQYGSEETDALGGSKDGEMELELFENDFIFEVLDQHNKPVIEKKSGKLVVTSLYHEGTPLIRYELQDIIAINENKVIVLGRDCEYAVLHDSVKLYPYHIDRVVSRVVGKLIKWQCIIEDKSEYIQVKVLTDDSQVEDKNISRIRKLLCQASIDIQTLTDSGQVKIQVKREKDGFILTNRGKCPRFVDKRTICNK